MNEYTNISPDSELTKKEEIVDQIVKIRSALIKALQQKKKASNLASDLQIEVDRLSDELMIEKE